MNRAPSQWTCTAPHKLSHSAALQTPTIAFCGIQYQETSLQALKVFYRVQVQPLSVPIATRRPIWIEVDTTSLKASTQALLEDHKKEKKSNYYSNQKESGHTGSGRDYSELDFSFTITLDNSKDEIQSPGSGA